MVEKKALCMCVYVHTCACTVDAMVASLSGSVSSALARATMVLIFSPGVQGIQYVSKTINLLS